MNFYYSKKNDSYIFIVYQDVPHDYNKYLVENIKVRKNYINLS
jgi:hypothetical protein